MASTLAKLKSDLDKHIKRRADAQRRNAPQVVAIETRKIKALRRQIADIERRRGINRRRPGQRPGRNRVAPDRARRLRAARARARAARLRELARKSSVSAQRKAFLKRAEVEEANASALTVGGSPISTVDSEEAASLRARANRLRAAGRAREAAIVDVKAARAEDAALRTTYQEGSVPETDEVDEADGSELDEGGGDTGIAKLADEPWYKRYAVPLAIGGGVLLLVAASKGGKGRGRSATLAVRASSGKPKPVKFGTLKLGS